MVYTMHIYVDGACRNNGRAKPTASAAVIFKNRMGKYLNPKTEKLTSFPKPTNQRAELSAMILALGEALARCAALTSSPKVRVVIRSDSKYAIGCMGEWMPKWEKNGFRNALGKPVANLDLVERAAVLNAELRGKGALKYIWVPREDNRVADKWCNKVLDGRV